MNLYDVPFLRLSAVIAAVMMDSTLSGSGRCDLDAFFWAGSGAERLCLDGVFFALAAFDDDRFLSVFDFDGTRSVFTVCFNADLDGVLSAFIADLDVDVVGVLSTLKTSGLDTDLERLLLLTRERGIVTSTK